MTKNVELAKVKAKILALTAMTVENGASEAEAFMAMKKVGQLLEQYNISMTDIAEVRNETCVTGEYDTGSKHSGVEVSVSVPISQFTNTKVWMSRTRSGIILNFFGVDTDVELAKYLVAIVANAFNTEYSKFKATEHYINYHGHRRVLNTSFMRGFTNRVNDRIIELTRANTKTYQNTTGTALVVVEKSKFVEEEFGKIGMKLRKAARYQTRARDRNAYGAGQSAGNKVTLNRPVGGSSTKQIT